MFINSYKTMFGHKVARVGLSIVGISHNELFNFNQF